MVIQSSSLRNSFQVHNTVQAKAQIVVVDLKHLAQQCPQPFEPAFGAKCRLQVVLRRMG